MILGKRRVPSKERPLSAEEQRERDRLHREVSPPPQGTPVDELCRRYEQALDLWTGHPLRGLDRAEWHEARADEEAVEHVKGNQALNDILAG